PDGPLEQSDVLDRGTPAVQATFLTETCATSTDFVTSSAVGRPFRTKSVDVAHVSVRNVACTAGVPRSRTSDCSSGPSGPRRVDPSRLTLPGSDGVIEGSRCDWLRRAGPLARLRVGACRAD